MSEYDKHGNKQWECICDCGNTTLVRQFSLNNGRVRSCGCINRDRTTTHGDSRNPKAPEYSAWQSMKNRCLKPEHKSWKDYGGRGITICPEWIDSYTTFLEDVGRRPSPNHSLDRIDNDAGYQKDNVRWATRTEQMRHTRNNRLVTAYGETKSIVEWSERAGIPWSILSDRLNSGWTPERAISDPIIQRGSNLSKLNPDQVIAIMARLLVGELPESVARFYSVSPQSIGDIWTGRTWSHLFAVDQLQGEPS